MAALFCCSTRRPSLPDQPNVKHPSSPNYMTSRSAKYPSIRPSNGTVGSSKSEGIEHIRRIFPSSQNEREKRTGRPIMHNSIHSESGARGTEQSLSATRIRDVIRKRLSRESGLSGRGSRRKTRATLSEEEIQRRSELKLALHQRVKDDILEDRRFSHGGYDRDAQILGTPDFSTMRSGAEKRSSPKNLRCLFGRPASSQSERTPCSNAAVFYRSSNKASSVRITQRESGKPSKQGFWWGGKRSDTPNSFEGVLLNKKVRSEVLDPLKSNHLKSIPLSDQNPTDKGLQLPEIVKTAPFINIFPTQLPISTDTASSQHDATTINAHLTKGNDSCLTKSRTIPDDAPELPRPEGELCAAEVHKLATLGCSLSRRSRDEQDFGGIDGHNSEDLAGSGKLTTMEDSAAGADCIAEEIRNIVIPPRSKSQWLHPAASVPQLEEASDLSQHKSSGSYSRTYSTQNDKGHRRSSSGFFNGEFRIPSRRLVPNAGSSVYTSQRGSIDSSLSKYSEHITSLPQQTEQMAVFDLSCQPSKLWNSSLSTTSMTGSPLERLESNLSRRRTIDTASFQSSTDSFILQELAAAAMRIVPKARNFSGPMSSRFKEELGFEPYNIKEKRGRSRAEKYHMKGFSPRNCDGRDDIDPALKEHGFVNNVVEKNEGGLTAGLWERVIHNHNEESPLDRDKSIRRDHTSFHKGEGFRKFLAQGTVQMHDSDSEAMFRSNRVKLGTPHTPDSSVKPHRKVMGRSTDSWARYPSHSRKERSSSPAGSADQVRTFDFAPTPVSSMHNKSVLGKKQKSRSMTFSKTIFKSWNNLYKSHSGHLKPFDHGYRTSMSVARGELEYPELEMVAALSPPTELPRKNSHGRRPVAPDYAPSILSQDSGAYGGERSAKDWSRLYADCVQRPHEPDVEASSHDISPVSETSQEAVQESLLNLPERREISSASESHMRASTLDFQKSLKIREAEAREKVLQEAKEAFVV